MVQSFRRFYLITIISLLLISVPAYWVSRQGKWEQYSIYEGRYLNALPPFSWQDFRTVTKRVLQGKLDQAKILLDDKLLSYPYRKDLNSGVLDQFPVRINLIRIARDFQRSMINVTYCFTDDPAIPASPESQLLIARDKSILFPPPALYDTSVKRDIDSRIENYRKLIRQFPEQRFFLFYLDRLPYSPYHPTNPYFPQVDRGQSFEYFEENLPQGLTLGKSMLNSYRDYEQGFYRTDHHWNIRGAWKGYEAIYKMLAPNYPEISPMLKLKGFKQLEGVEFLGTYARQTLHPVQPDIFEIAVVKVPPYEIYIDGVRSTYNQSKQYLSGKIDFTPYINHYGNYFGRLKQLVEYRFQNNAPRNLIIIGNSYTRPIQMYIASHYRNTYIVDLTRSNDFFLGKYIERYQIDDVLFFGDAVVYLDPTWTINP